MHKAATAVRVRGVVPVPFVGVSTIIFNVEVYFNVEVQFASWPKPILVVPR
jgi:hypothetical protein